MLHSKTGVDYRELSVVKIAYEFLQNQETVYFYWNIFDELKYDVKLSDCLDAKCINLLNLSKGNKLVIDFQGEIITEIDVGHLNKVLSKIDAKKLIIIVQDKLQEEYLKKHAREKIGFSHFLVDNYWIKDVAENTKIGNLLKNKKKFNFICRRHTSWRFLLLTNLYNQSLLKYFHLSYLGVAPDNEYRLTQQDLFLEEKKLETYTNLSKKLPIRLHENDNYGTDQNHPVIFEAIQKSDFSLIIESIFDQTACTERNVYKYSAMPIDVSEKTYKVIANKRPFIAFAMPYYLTGLRNLGFKTFHPIINESYDNEEDNYKRLKLVTEEVKRISTLRKKEYNKVIEKCKSISQYNLHVFNRINRETSYIQKQFH